MNNLKAWRLSESDVFAAETFEDAVAAAMKEYGLPREDIVDDHYAGPADLSLVVYEEDGSNPQTLGALLAEMTEPGLLFAADV